mmetsp:Transcript_82880/g.222304  ORF Transcript_82880/g.222304 Transcript_82880/m.222304 type:complete len:210 (-) Transcript_82880:222-851(-)
MSLATRSACGHRYHSRELCSIINQCLREDDAELLVDLMPVVRAINQLCVVQGEKRENQPQIQAHQWPSSGKCFRGGSLPEEHKAFFSEGLKYRVPGFLATSLSEEVASKFAERQFDLSNGSAHCVLWIVEVDPRGANDPRLRCKQVNYVRHSNLEDVEQEFLFAPYSVFTVQRAEWSPNPTYVSPHRIFLAAARDNRVEPEDLPLAPWY